MIYSPPSLCPGGQSAGTATLLYVNHGKSCGNTIGTFIMEKYCFSAAKVTSAHCISMQNHCSKNITWPFKILLNLAGICMSAANFSTRSQISVDLIQVSDLPLWWLGGSWRPCYIMICGMASWVMKGRTGSSAGGFGMLCRYNEMGKKSYKNSDHKNHTISSIAHF